MICRNRVRARRGSISYFARRFPTQELLLLFAALLFQRCAFGAVGTVPGELSVTPGGGATYNVPISVPPGFGGMQPDLSLVYSSRSGNGWLGVGWNIGGLSSIQRCPKTYEQDGVFRGVKLDTADRFCLDGVRLVDVSGPYGSTGTEYRTEIEGYSKIVQKGDGCGGPCGFTVYTKSGLIREYGGSYNARQNLYGQTSTVGWQLREIRDTLGNNITFQYDKRVTVDANWHRLLRVAYGDAGGAQAGEIDFTYAPNRPDPINQYSYGAVVVQTHLLDSVATYDATGDAVQTYRLSYATSPSNGQSLLQSIEQCAGASTTDCLAPTGFEWYGGTAAFDTWRRPSTSRFPANPDKCRGIAQADANGDGRMDVVCTYDTDNVGGGSNVTYVQLGTATGFGAWQTWYSGPQTSSVDLGLCDKIVAADFNGDGLADMVCLRVTYVWGGTLGTPESYRIQAFVQLSTGTSYSAWNSWLDVTGAGSRSCIGSPVVDADGDGRSDLVCLDIRSSQVWLSTGTGVTAKAFVSSAGGPSKAERCRHLTHGDVNGDGLADLICMYDTSGTGVGDSFAWVQLSSGNGTFAGWTQWGETRVGFDLEWCNELRDADVNGDGLVDIVCIDTDSGVYRTALSTGTGFLQLTDWSADILLNNCLEYIAADADGDGKADLICPQNATGGKTWVKRTNADATGFGPWEVWATSTVTGVGCQRTLLGDVDGNNLPDIVCLGNDGDQYVYVQPFRYADGVNGSSGSMAYLAGDVLNAVDDGIGQPTEIRYSTLADTAVYDPAIGSGCTGSGSADYPIICRVGTQYVVAEVKADDGIGSLAGKTYFYKSGRGHLRGRGFLGFGETVTTDDATHGGKIVSTRYSQAFSATRPLVKSLYPQQGMPVNVSVKQADGTLISRKLSVWETRDTGGTRFEVFETSSSEYGFEADGGLVKVASTSTGNFDAYGNPGLVEVTTSDMVQSFTKSTSSLYDNDTANWLLGRLTSSTVTSTTPTDTQTRTSAFEYDPTTGLLTAEIVEPGDPELELRTEYLYDSHGNKRQTTVRDSGSAQYGIALRWTTEDYDYANLPTLGTYTVTSTNAKGHTEIKTVDSGFGNVLELVGPNNLSTSWTFDGFGRNLSESRADGTTTTTTRAWCTGACVSSGASYTVKVDATGAAPVTTYYDALSREIRAETVGLFGTSVLKDSEYDSIGRLKRESRNYFAGSSRTWTNYQYDALDRLIKTVSPDGGIVDTDYQGLITQVRSRDVPSYYDQTVVHIANALGEEIEVVDAAGNSLFKEYDAFGNLTRSTDTAGNATLMTYDRRGRKTGMTDPDMGVWQYRYDALDQLRWQKDAKNQVTTQTYDVLGRMDSRQEPEGTTTWTYDVGYNAKGKLTGVASPGGFSQALTYDNVGRPKTDSRTLSGVTLTTTNYYNNKGLLWGVQYPTGFRVDYIYDTWGHLLKVRNNANTAEVYWHAKDGDADGNVTFVTLGNGLDTARTYDPYSGRLTGISTGFGSSSDVQYLTYLYDALGNLRERSSVRNLQTQTETFGYDALNRVTAATLVGVGSTAYAYNAIGNITAKGPITNYQYGQNGYGPHAVTAANGGTYQYDSNGNVTWAAGRSLQWTSYNKPKKITLGADSISFVYGPDRARFKQTKVLGGVTTVTRYFGGLYERVGSNEHRHYILAGSETVAIYTQKNGTDDVRYLHGDHLGSTDAVTDEGGNLIDAASFDAFGSYRNLNWNGATGNLALTATNRGYTGHEQLDDVGLVHMNGRVYDPTLGRFLSADPIVQFASNQQSYNRYSYVLNSPLSFTDPSGHGLELTHVFGLGKALFDRIDGTLQKHSELMQYVSIGAAIACGGPANPAAAAACAGIVSGATARASGASWNDSVTSGAITFATAFAFKLVGDVDTFNPYERVLAHGVVGGLSSAASGDGFKSGFQAAAFSAAATVSPIFQNISNEGVQIVATAVIGGTASSLGGGKFANGAVTGAFGYLFNDAVHRHYDHDAAYYHYYALHNEICSTDMIGCTVERVWEGLRRYPAPGHDASTLAYSGQETKIRFLGFSGGKVLHTVDSTNLTIYNDTIPGHIFDHGYVSRTVVVAGNSISIHTVGEGVNQSAFKTWLNMKVYRPGFEKLDNHIRNFVLK